MSQIIKPVMLDETGQVTNQKIDNLKNDITQALGTLSTNIDTTLTNYAQSQEETLSDFAGEMNDTLSDFAGDISTTMSNLANDLVGVLVSLKSVNGKYGVVVLDGNDLKIDKSQQNSKTVTSMMTEMQNAIAKTPLTFSASQIEDDDYLLTIALGTPA